jgi:hypothetical protein
MTRRWALLLLLACADSAPTRPSSSPVEEACAAPACPPPRNVFEGPPALEPPAPDGTRCETALALPGTGDSSALLETTGVAPLLGCAPALGAAGAYFELDLSAARAPVPVQLLFDAPLPFEVGLARGACGDLRVEQCATPLYSNERSRLIATTLAPDRYLLLVDSAASGAQLHVSARAGALGCSAAPANDECASALPLDLRAPVQSVSGTLACAHPSVNLRCSSFEAADVFYTLDLSDRSGVTLLDIDAVGPDQHPVTAALFGAAGEVCGDVRMCGGEFSARLAPGVYRIGVSAAEGRPAGASHPGLADVADGELAPFALRIGLRQDDCSQTRNTSWQTAIDLDPSAERQLIQGNTACGSSTLGAAACYGDRGAPELYYRLDLRGAPGPRKLVTNSLLNSDTVSYVLLDDPEGGVPQLTSCNPYFDDGVAYDLAPRLYYLVMDGRVRNSARFEFEVQLSDERRQNLTCVNQAIEECMTDSEPACSDSMANPRCLASAVECGLEQSAYEAFCGGAPGCCSGTEGAPDCLQAWQSTARCR